MYNKTSLNITADIVPSYFGKTIWVWIILAATIYIVLACQFPTCRFITMPYSEATVELWNDVLKNLSYSYIAAVIFFVFSDTIPFLRKQYYVTQSLVVIKKQTAESAIRFFRCFCSSCEDDFQSDTLYYNTTGYEYDELGTCELQRNKLYELKLVYTTIAFYTDQIITHGEYAGKANFDFAVKVKSNVVFSLMAGYIQAAENVSITNKDLMDIIKFTLSIKNELNN